MNGWAAVLGAPLSLNVPQLLRCDAPMTVVGRARIDARADLVRALGVPPGTGDLELIAGAYRRWGEACVEHFIGDFSFALWDGERLFCARDRFGIRPLYHARFGETLIATDTLAALLDVVPRTLDQEALALFFIHGVNTDLRRTTYAHVSRVPPAHRLVADGDRLRVERYWSFALRDEPLRIDEREAAEELGRHLDLAVRDRARGTAVVSMSGGIDSTAVAATLVRGGANGVRAVTSVWDELIPDQERGFAASAARALGIEIDYQVCDRYEPFERWDDPAIRGIEPKSEPFSAAFHDLIRMAAARGTLLLGGWGADPMLATSQSYFVDLLRRGRWLRFAREAAGFALTRRRRPPLLLRTRFLRAIGVHTNRDTPPPWLKPELRARWNDWPTADDRRHRWRPEAFRGLTSNAWPAVFESYDASATGQPIEYAAPFFDVRLLEFALSLPPMPHFAGKDILRQAMRGALPDEVRLRPKTPLQGDPLAVVWPRTLRRWAAVVEECDALDAFLNRRILLERFLQGTHSDVRHQSTAVALGLWLRYQTRP
ncbi:MAG TPA: asparagine synthase-related protein [Thermoanaerobaculia bacterium]|nr:asparagine synthase-related protein [Thermoanaerobaculia bacterium]